METIKKNIKSLSERINAVLKKIEVAEAEITRAEAAVTANDPVSGRLAELERKRSDEIGRAFIEKRSPLIADIDSEIATLKHEKANIQAASDAAQRALPLIREDIARLENDLRTLEDERDAEINALSMERVAQAYEAFQKALRDVGQSLVQISVAEAISRKPFDPRTGTYARRLCEQLNAGYMFRDIPDSEAALKSIWAEMAELGVPQRNRKIFHPNAM